MVEIEWSSIAQNDLNKIIDYIAQDSLEYHQPRITFLVEGRLSLNE